MKKIIYNDYQVTYKNKTWLICATDTDQAKKVIALVKNIRKPQLIEVRLYKKD